MTTNIERQMWAVQNLEIAPRPNCTVIKYEVEEWFYGFMFVRREYCPDHAQRISYVQQFKIGPRGAVTKISETMY